ncbi:TIGR04086 family membrane protein [Paenibacillus turpanensis]|uniref:TIGR04086 family membrane protein n=1 Tax=Paenibacillus turpanensis TaxID=2689078 RepID=UPI001407B918|nr:TIGR04086 family membrane protein [Paenibacillus turpanensis]
MNPMSKMSKVRVSSPVLTGLLYSFIMLGISVLLLSFMLKFTGFQEQSLPVYVYIVHALALFIGGLVSGRRTDKRGWYYGGLVGLIYAAIIILAGFLSYDAAFTSQTLTLIGLAFGAGALGGMIGVNMRK